MSVASPNDNEALLIALHRSGVEYILVGGLIEVKRAAGRPKDFEAISELESLLEERESDLEGRHE